VTAPVGLEAKDVELAERGILEAIRIQEEIGARPELARSYVTYAHVLEATGKSREARRYLVRASDMLRQMSMVWDLARVERALRD
jgi:hypothetical protein